MAEKTREQRAEGRERRRSLMSKPFEKLDEAAGRQDGESTELAAAKRAAATAAATALAGALAGAAKAWVDRRSAESDEQAEASDDVDRQPKGEQQTADEPEPDEADEPQDEQPAAEGQPAEPDEQTEPQGEPKAEEPAAEEPAPDDDEPQHEQPAAAAEPDERDSQTAEAERDQRSSDHDGNGSRGASPSDAAQIVRQARRHLQELLGAEAESVSGLERANGNWSVTLEVVEMRRVPESTDVLSSYSVVLDDDGGVVSLNRGRRYRRSQVEER